MVVTKPCYKIILVCADRWSCGRKITECTGKSPDPLNFIWQKEAIWGDECGTIPASSFFLWKESGKGSNRTKKIIWHYSGIVHSPFNPAGYWRLGKIRLQQLLL